MEELELILYKSILNNNVDKSEEIYDKITKLLDKRISQNLMVFNMKKLFEDNSDIINKRMVEELDELITIGVSCVYVFDLFEKYEYSKIIYEKMEDLYLQIFFLMEDNKTIINEKTLEEEVKKSYKNLFNDIYTELKQLKDLEI